MKLKINQEIIYGNERRLIVAVYNTVLGTAYDTKNNKGEIEVLFERNLRRVSNDTIRSN